MERLEKMMAQAGLDQWGICSYKDALPLLDVRSKSRIPHNAKSIIVILFGYYVGDYPNRNISRYAIVDDYHDVVGQKLAALAELLKESYNEYEFIPFVDSSPIYEVRAAQLAGLGEIGMNGQLLNPVYGSYCFIGTIVTTLKLSPATPSIQHICLRCSKCIDACPTGALSANGFEVDKCRSHITQKKKLADEWERDQIKQGGYVWGCDCCTDACPINQTAKHSPVAAFYKDIQPVVGQDNAERLCGTKAYGWRGENVLLRNLKIICAEERNPTPPQFSEPV